MMNSSIAVPLESHKLIQCLASEGLPHRRLSLPPAPCLARIQRGEPSTLKTPSTSETLRTLLVLATGTPDAAKTFWVSSLSWATVITFGDGRKTDAGSSPLLAESTSASLEGWG